MNSTHIKFDDHKAQAEAWRMLRGEIALDMGYLLELIDVTPVSYLPRVRPEQLQGYMDNFLYCQECGDLLSVENCVTCLGIGLDDCTECAGYGGVVYCERCDAEDDDDDSDLIVR